MKANLVFKAQKNCPFSLNKGVPSIEVIDTKIMWKFFLEQILCLLNRVVPKERFLCIMKVVQSHHISEVNANVHVHFPIVGYC